MDAWYFTWIMPLFLVLVHLFAVFFTLRDKYGQTIIIVTHDPDLAKMCDRSLYMVDGQFVSQ